jgi:hypothetical protein
MAIYFYHLRRFLGLISNNFIEVGILERCKSSKDISGIESSARM